MILIFSGIIQNFSFFEQRDWSISVGYLLLIILSIFIIHHIHQELKLYSTIFKYDKFVNKLNVFIHGSLYLICILLIMSINLNVSTTFKETNKDVYISESYSEIHNKLSSYSKDLNLKCLQLTTVQCQSLKQNYQELKNGYVGKYVTWQGAVTDVKRGVVYVSVPITSNEGAPVTLYGTNAVWSQLNKGQIITFTGRITDSYALEFPNFATLKLEEVKIINQLE